MYLSPSGESNAKDLLFSLVIREEIVSIASIISVFSGFLLIFDIN
jgi:hypothetical protein